MAKGSVNKAILIGNVTKDPDIRVFDNGGKVARFGLATNDGYKGHDGNWVDKPNFHNIKVNGKLVDVIEKYVKQGDKLYIEGAIEYGEYEAKDGTKKRFTDIQAWEITMLGSKGGAKTNEKSEVKSPPKTKVTPPPSTIIEEDDDDDLPF